MSTKNDKQTGAEETAETSARVNALVIPQKLFDKHGTLIRPGDTVFNEADRDQYHTVLIGGDGRLYLGDLDSPLERYSPDRFWEIYRNC